MLVINIRISNGPTIGPIDPGQHRVHQTLEFQRVGEHQLHLGSKSGTRAALGAAAVAGGIIALGGFLYSVLDNQGTNGCRSIAATVDQGTNQINAVATDALRALWAAVSAANTLGLKMARVQPIVISTADRVDQVRKGWSPRGPKTRGAGHQP